MMRRLSAAWAAFLDPTGDEVRHVCHWYNLSVYLANQLDKVLTAHTLWAAQEHARKALGEKE